ncbi:MAG: LysM peptidoglycan-binding domain-containing protein [Dehalococcoidia bacterium]
MAEDQIPSCHYCENPAEAECPTCGRLYCTEHGEDVCLRCMAPEAAAPSGAVYRGSVLALVIATIVVVFLLVSPPETKSGNSLVRDLPTSTAAVAATATPTAPGNATQPTPRPGTQVPSSVTPATPTTPEPTVQGSPTPAGKTYVMQAGDTLSAVAASYGVSVADIVAANPGLNPDAIAIGTEIRIP